MPKNIFSEKSGTFFDQIDQKWPKIYHLGLFIQNDPHVLASDLYFQKSYSVLDAYSAGHFFTFQMPKTLQWK